jgi:hypothetical protein
MGPLRLHALVSRGTPKCRIMEVARRRGTGSYLQASADAASLLQARKVLPPPWGPGPPARSFLPDLRIAIARRRARRTRAARRCRTDGPAGSPGPRGLRSRSKCVSSHGSVRCERASCSSAPALDRTVSSARHRRRRDRTLRPELMQTSSIGRRCGFIAGPD